MVGCTRLPEVVGGGKLWPRKRLYKDGNKVKLSCRRGYEVVGETHSICVGEEFEPDTLKCSKIGL